MTTPETPARPARPLGRYGPPPAPRRRRAAVAAVVALTVVGLAWVVYAGLGAAQRDVRWSDVGYDVVDATTVEVTFSVVKDPGATAVCRVEALDARFAQVGIATVDVGPSDERGVTSRVTVRTQERAVTGVVDTCTVP